MLSTGDIKSGFRILEALLRAIKYPGQVDFRGLSKGDPSAFLPIVSFTVNSFSPLFTKQLMVAGLELMGKTDLRFTDALYKMLRDMFHYKPILTKQQFLQWGFSQRKMSMVCDVINLVMERHKQLRKPKVRGSASHRGDGEAAAAHLDTVFSSNTPESQNIELPGELPGELPAVPHDADNSLHVEERLSAVESQLDGVISKLSRLSVLERRLQDLESAAGTKNVEEEVISISRVAWENLLSRLSLLETQLEQGSNTQAVVSLSQQSSSTSTTTSEDIKDSLEKIANMLKSTSTLLKTSDSCTAP
ncbi:unnamed protein product [Ophioblennius macclurei]